jgi:hypothetical protein
MAGGAAEAFVLDARLAHIKGMLGVLQTVKQTKKQARARAAAGGSARQERRLAQGLSACAAPVRACCCADGHAAGGSARAGGVHVRRLARDASLRALQSRGAARKHENTSKRSAAAPCLLRSRRAGACRQVFTEYAFRGADGALRQCFSTSLSNLVDSLAVCAASDGHADLTLRWPDHDGRLLLQCVARDHTRMRHHCAALSALPLRRLNAVRDVDDDGATVDSCIYAEISCEASNLAEDLEGEMTQPRSQFTLPV